MKRLIYTKTFKNIHKELGFSGSDIQKNISKY